jgi:60 kDa SS-A/Ro ribonucleoprotein
MVVKNHMAILRNMRNIDGACVSEGHINKLKNAFGHPSWSKSRVLPFRFIAAAKHAPRWEPFLEKAMTISLKERQRFIGSTAILVDVSGSMDEKLSEKSDMDRIDAGCGLAIIMRELCDEVRVYSFSNKIAEIPARRGFALRDAIRQSQPHQGTYLGAAVGFLNGIGFHRTIVITDEQSHDQVPACKGKGYMINVASYQNGVGYGNSWTHVNGWSEAVLDYIHEFEKPQAEK